MKFSAALRAEAEPLWRASLEHPFVRGLADGSLPLDCFRHYVLQDGYYLRCFARVQALAAARAPDLDTARGFAVHLQATCDAERGLHESLLGELGISPAEYAAAEPAPTAYAYTSHLLRVAYEGTAGEIAAAVLPCYWLYREIGEALRAARPGVEPYRRWIAAYGDEGYDRLVRELVGWIDAFAARAPEEERGAMRRHFLISSRYEWRFWEMAYRLETWDRPCPEIGQPGGRPG